MGNSCKKIMYAKRNRTPPDDFNQRFDFQSDNNSSWDNPSYYNELYIRNFNCENEFLNNNNNTLSLDNEGNFMANNSLVYINELYDILENENKVKIKKVDNSDIEEFLIIEKHIKLKRKKKKINPFKKKKEKFGKDEENNKLPLHKSDGNDKYKFVVPSFPGDSSQNKKKSKIKDRTHSKNTELETWCSSSNDNRYDIFEEDRRHILKQKQQKEKAGAKGSDQKGGTKDSNNDKSKNKVHNNAKTKDKVDNKAKDKNKTDNNAKGNPNGNTNNLRNQQNMDHEFNLRFENSEELDSIKGKELNNGTKRFREPFPD
ncbi:hypothetical protein, conserved [Plasmodium gonderi]|uniref:Uncharacterized protein n=1 Tax=Plasmodium gonderi TaxID=77519 RepID=A0A1Y1JL72_PLAGO|nr:hypothetical protein, conserved [Plasmodium gonderi]GAW81542.1 hypothetical protein, conserved [Plasmodium gonderi]